MLLTTNVEPSTEAMPQVMQDVNTTFVDNGLPAKDTYKAISHKNTVMGLNTVMRLGSADFPKVNKTPSQIRYCHAQFLIASSTHQTKKWCKIHLRRTHNWTTEMVANFRLPTTPVNIGTTETFHCLSSSCTFTSCSSKVLKIHLRKGHPWSIQQMESALAITN